MRYPVFVFQEKYYRTKQFLILKQTNVSLANILLCEAVIEIFIISNTKINNMSFSGLFVISIIDLITHYKRALTRAFKGSEMFLCRLR